jgi:hypothetical protein
VAEAEAPIGDSSTVEAAPSTDDTVDAEPAEPAAEAATEVAATDEGTAEEAPAGEQSDEDISLEAILEDLKRREGRSG